MPFASVRRLIGAAMMISALAVSSGSVEAGSDRAPLVIGYLGSWRAYEGRPLLAELPAGQLSHVFYAFGALTGAGIAELGDACADVGECAAGQRAPSPGGNFAALRALKQRYAHLQVLISIGGWSGSRHFSDVAATQEGRERFVASAIEVFLRAHPDLFDGIDINWEFPVAGGAPGNSARAADRENFSLLIEEFRRQLDALGADFKRRYLLSAAVSGSPALIENIEAARLATLLDGISVMTYDYHAGASVTHFNAPLFAAQADPAPQANVDASVRALIAAGVPPHKLVLGVPFYGRGYRSVAENNEGLFQPAEATGEDWGVGPIDYRALVAARPQENGFERHWESQAQVPWLYNRKSRVWISYDDPESIAAKAFYARQHGLAGIMIWELGGDDGSLLTAIHHGFAGAFKARLDSIQRPILPD